MKTDIRSRCEHPGQPTACRNPANRVLPGCIAFSVLPLTLILAACGGSSTQMQQQQPPPPKAPFFLQAIPYYPPMTPGSTYAASISAMPLTGVHFQGTISVTITGLPASLTATPSSFTADPSNYGWFAVSLNADSSLALGVYPFTVTATSGNATYIMTMAVGLLAPPPQSSAMQSQVIYRFTGLLDGAGPSGPLIADSTGNLYGTAYNGGDYGTGVVYELLPSNGGWTEMVLHSFGGGTDGSGPLGPLIFDSAGNIYGVTHNGGTAGYGTVFELMPTNSGWQESVLYSFANRSDGENPSTGVVMDADGNLYGTTQDGGAVGSQYCPTGCGNVFALTHSGNTWTHTIIHNFLYSPDGNDPGGSQIPGEGLVIDGQGNLYGTTFDGGSWSCPERTPYSGGQGCGVIFKMTPSGGAWQFSLLQSFTNAYDAFVPTGLLLDPSGNLYLTSYGGFATPQCQSSSCGNFFQVTPSGTMTQLWHFWGDNLGYSPSGLVRDPSGNFYGVTMGGPI